MTVSVAPAMITGVPVVLLVLAALGLLITMGGLAGMVLRRPIPPVVESPPPRVLV